MINANVTQIELTDEQLSQVVGGCGGHEQRDDDCGGDSYGGERRRRNRGGCGNYGWGQSSYESDYSEERHYHRSSSSGCDY
jgi:bacteriocin-like protein